MRPLRIPPLMTEIVRTGISAVDGLIFSGHAACPFCGGPLAGYDTRHKQFAHLVSGDSERTIFVSVRRFYCRQCRRICYADEPFYPGTRAGSVVVDLCMTLSMTMPPNRVAAYLAAMGVRVNRMSCRLYVLNGSSSAVQTDARSIDANRMFGIHLPRSILSLSVLALEAGEVSRVSAEDVLAACGYPSRQRQPGNSIGRKTVQNKKGDDAGGETV